MRQLDREVRDKIKKMDIRIDYLRHRIDNSDEPSRVKWDLIEERHRFVLMRWELMRDYGLAQSLPKLTGSEEFIFVRGSTDV